MKKSVFHGKIRFIITLIVVIFGIFSLTGCTSEGRREGRLTTYADSNAAIDDEVPSDESDGAEKPYAAAHGTELWQNNFPDAKTLKAHYPGKIVLTWIFEETLYDRNFRFPTWEVNDYLDSIGCDYAVCFVPVSAPLQNDSDENTYTSKIWDMIENGEQVDIIFDSGQAASEAGNSAYWKDAFSGLFIPIDAYLSDTDIGRELHDLMPKEHWNALTVNGSIFGVDGYMSSVDNAFTYQYNAALVEKYGYDINIPPYEQMEKIYEIADKENCDAVSCGGYAWIVCDWTNAKMLDSCVYWDESEKRAKSIFENDDYITKLKWLFNCRPDSPTANDHKESCFLMTSAVYGKVGGGISARRYYDNSIDVVSVSEDGYIISAYNATGICSASDHKDMAFDLLARVQTDKYLNNLLTYGVEDTDYMIENGIPDTVTNPFNSYRFANRMICYPESSDDMTAEEYSDFYKNASTSSDIKFAFDAREVIDESKNTCLAMYELDDTDKWGDFKDADEFIEYYKQKLKEAGIDKIIDECNRQYGEYERSKITNY